MSSDRLDPLDLLDFLNPLDLLNLTERFLYGRSIALSVCYLIIS